MQDVSIQTKKNYRNKILGQVFWSGYDGSDKESAVLFLDDSRTERGWEVGDCRVTVSTVDAHE